LRIPLDRQSKVALYRQIEDFLRQNILAGSLAPEARLPSTRQLAEELGVSRITVKNAYAVLESDGLISSSEGSGTFVSLPAAYGTGENTDKGIEWPAWQQNVKTDRVFSREIYRGPYPAQVQTERPIIFAGFSDSRQFPAKDFYRAMLRVMRRDGVEALEFGDFNAGYKPLRETIARVLSGQGIQAHPDQVLITSGSQQAVGLLCQILLHPGDVILVESPTYNLALELFRSLDLQIVGVPVDKHGMQVELVEPLLQQHRPKLIYTIPNFHNPTGTCMSGVRRRQLVALADQYDVPILEDDFAGDLRYDGVAQPAIKALDPGGRVVYAGTFSKMLMPGLRLGFLVAEGPIFRALLHAKWVNDLATSNLIQRALDEYVTVGRYQAHLRRTCRVNRVRRDAMQAAIKQYLPKEVQFYPPKGGLFIWLRLPEGVSSLDLLPLALEQGVEFTPGNWFFSDSVEGEAYLRLNFSVQTPEDIRIGIRRLGIALDRCMETAHRS
jgi:GntR family transcriptional regulator/MocR family aminotransferase